jgi:hypothetical protein
VRWAALLAGLAAGVLNYALLARGCKRLTGGGRRGALWILGGACVAVAGLGLCAALAPRLLPWFGCACAGALGLLAVARMAYFIRKKK